MKTFKQVIKETSLKFELDSGHGAWQAGATFQLDLFHYGQVSLSSPEYDKKGWLGIISSKFWTGKNQKDDIIYKGYHKSYKEMISKTEKALKKHTKGKWDLKKAPTEEELMNGDLKNRHTDSAN